jgi:hypothetical protein
MLTYINVNKKLGINYETLEIFLEKWIIVNGKLTPITAVPIVQETNSWRNRATDQYEV